MVLTVSPMMATKVRVRSSCGVKKRPSTMPMSRMPARSAEAPQDGSGLQGDVVALHIGRVIAVRAVKDAISVDRFHETRVHRADGLVAPDLFEQFAPAQTVPGSGDLRHQKRLRAEGLGGALFGIHAEPSNGRAHHDDAGHTDDHARASVRKLRSLCARMESIARRKAFLKLMPGAGTPRARLNHVFPG